jgi:hypothetical protein
MTAGLVKLFKGYERIQVIKSLEHYAEQLCIADDYYFSGLKFYACITIRNSMENISAQFHATL